MINTSGLFIANRTPRAIYGVSFAIAVLCCFVVLWLTAKTARIIILESVAERSGHTLNLVKERLAGELSKYLYHPQLLSTNPDVTAVLTRNMRTSEIRSVNEKLELVKRISGALAIYVMNRHGLVVATSNWNDRHSFLSENFSFRPHFQAAMQGRLGRYFGAGTVSEERGYYFAYPVRSDNQIIGVIAVKMSLNVVESGWNFRDQEILAVDANGVVLLSSVPNWRLRSLDQLDKHTELQIRNKRNFSDIDMQPLKATIFSDDSGTAENAILFDTEQNPSRFMIAHSRMEDTGWTIVILTSTSAISGQVNLTLFVVASFLVSLLLLCANFYQHKIRLKDRIALQNEARINLEARVRDRTAKLLLSNKKLKIEIGERKKAEAELCQSQSELVRAEKLAALGQMSAGLCHEINQPLAAIRFYSDNKQKYLDNNDLAKTKINLASISKLTERMAKIVRHLRSCASTKPAEISSVSLKPCLEEALALLQHRIKRNNISVVFHPHSDNLFVMGGNIQLQQVFLNLLNNSIDALNDGQNKIIRVSTLRHHNTINIDFEDSGTGISSINREKIFDPLFTTKTPGEGLGLGLSISRSIVKQIGGIISVGDSELGGAKITVALKPTYESEERAA